METLGQDLLIKNIMLQFSWEFTFVQFSVKCKLHFEDSSVFPESSFKAYTINFFDVFIVSRCYS